MISPTRTYVAMPVDAGVYATIKTILENAGYGHCLGHDPCGDGILMDGVVVVPGWMMPPSTRELPMPACVAAAVLFFPFALVRGAIYSADNFAQYQTEGMMQPVDGVGFWATEQQTSMLSVHKNPKPDWATHVVWRAAR